MSEQEKEKKPLKYNNPSLVAAILELMNHLVVTTKSYETLFHLVKN
jgi:hypothetical protein